jgi:hypothetical protein
MTPPIRTTPFVRSILAVVLTFPLAGLLLLGRAVEGEAARFTAWTRFSGEINGLVLAGLLVLLMAPSASAESAWVLWRYYSHSFNGGSLGNVRDTNLVDAYPTYEQCRQDIPWRVRQALTQEAPSGGIIASSISEQRGNSVVRTTRHVDANYNTSRLRWQCLPAGTDPRGPGR